MQPQCELRLNASSRSSTLCNPVTETGIGISPSTLTTDLKSAQEFSRVHRRRSYSHHGSGVRCTYYWRRRRQAGKNSGIASSVSEPTAVHHRSGLGGLDAGQRYKSRKLWWKPRHTMVVDFFSDSRDDFACFDYGRVASH